jgi:XapX domain-containing protein
VGPVLLRDGEALGVGLLIGFLFARIGLPIPAPPALAGVLGIVGIYLGFKLASLI